MKVLNPKEREKALRIRKARVDFRISAIPKRPRFGHWPIMYWSCKRLAEKDSWYYTQMELAKKLWREDLLENSNKHRSQWSEAR